MSNTKALEQIKSYLDNRAKEDELFAKMYGKPKKDLNGCWAYIVGVAQKRGNAVCMTDEEVYGLAVHYYCEDDLKVEPLPKGFSVKAGNNENVKLSDDEIAKIRAEVESECREKMRKEMEKVRDVKPKKRAPAKVEAMGCLFDF